MFKRKVAEIKRSDCPYNQEFRINKDSHRQKLYWNIVKLHRTFSKTTGAATICNFLLGGVTLFRKAIFFSHKKVDIYFRH